MERLVSDIINETVELPETILEHGYGTYTVTKTLTIVQNNEEWEYVVRYNGSPLSFENEQIYSKGYASAEDAAKAAINQFKILAVRGGRAIVRPELAAPTQKVCHACQWYLQSVSFCAVNPCNLENATTCPDFSEPERAVPSPVIPIKQLGKALIKCGLV